VKSVEEKGYSSLKKEVLGECKQEVSQIEKGRGRKEFIEEGRNIGGKHLRKSEKKKYQSKKKANLETLLRIPEADYFYRKKLN